jgi:hypothetical protein
MYRILVAASLILIAAVPAVADDISDELKSALQKYESGDVAGALDAVRLAETWLLEKQGSELTGVFPDLPGWEKEIGEYQAAGMAMMGGGISASCEYTKGDDRMEVEIVGNSPLMAMASGIVGNALMASSSGSKIIKVHGTKSAIKQEDEEWELMIPYQGTMLITVTTTTTQDDAINCAEKLDWKKLEATLTAE